MLVFPFVTQILIYCSIHCRHQVNFRCSMEAMEVPQNLHLNTCMGLFQSSRKKLSCTYPKLWACLVLVFENSFLFSKTRRTRKTCLVPNFFSSGKTQRTYKTLNVENKNNFQKTQKWCSLCIQKLFSRTVFKNRNQTGP